jgi:hypothetical protein
MVGVFFEQMLLGLFCGGRFFPSVRHQPTNQPTKVCGMMAPRSKI